MKISFFYLFYNSSKFLEQLLFLGKMHFFTPKKQFPKKHGFWCIFWQYSYNKSPVNKTSQSGIVALILDQFSACQASYLGSPQWFNWGYCCSYEKTHYCNNSNNRPLFYPNLFQHLYYIIVSCGQCLKKRVKLNAMSQVWCMVYQ